MRTFTAEQRAACRARMLSIAPVPALDRAVAIPACTAQAAASASTGSDLPRPRRAGRLGRSTSTTATPRARSQRLRATGNRAGGDYGERARPPATVEVLAIFPAG